MINCYVQIYNKEYLSIYSWWIDLGYLIVPRWSYCHWNERKTIC